jgi:hypothetical protein
MESATGLAAVTSKQFDGENGEKITVKKLTVNGILLLAERIDPASLKMPPALLDMTFVSTKEPDPETAADIISRNQTEVARVVAELVKKNIPLWPFIIQDATGLDESAVKSLTYFDGLKVVTTVLSLMDVPKTVTLFREFFTALGGLMGEVTKQAEAPAAAA